MSKEKSFISPELEHHEDSITASSWLVRPTTAERGLGDEARRLIELLARALRSRGLQARTLRLIVESPNGRSVVRRASLEPGGSSAPNLSAVAFQLLDTINPSLSAVSIRGVVTGLFQLDPPQQMELFSTTASSTPEENSRHRIDLALEAVQAKLGGHVVGRGDDFGA